jgi:hypothetical protein
MGSSMAARHKYQVFPETHHTAAELEDSQLGIPVPNVTRLFSGVPTHAVGIVGERRVCPRAFLRLPLRLTRVGKTFESVPVTLITKNISSSGVYFLSPQHIQPGTSIELEVALVERPMGMGTVRMATAAHIIRSEKSETPGWHGVAASFDNYEFQCDEALPVRFRKP